MQAMKPSHALEAQRSERSIAVVLPMREQVTRGRAGAVALNVAEYGQVSRLRDRLLVVGATETGDFALPYRRVRSRSWPIWRRDIDRYADAVAHVIAEHRCSLVEVHNRGRLFLRLAQRLGPDVRMCLYLHNDPQSMEALNRPAQRARILQRASLVYCLSSYIRDRYLDGVEGPAERVVVLPNGIVPPAERPSREQSLLYVGRLIPEKGVEELFAALHHVAGELPDWRVSIIGRAPAQHRRRYRRSLAELQAIWGDRLLWTEAMPHAQVMAAFARAAITVVPSRWQEPFGRTALEGLAAGSAVIASRTGGLPEIVGDAGLLLDSVTPGAIASAILALAHDPGRRAALGQAGEQRAATRFDIHLLSQRLDDLRCSLLARE
jgi:glycosyltransferase involved in cell wall biosynthesis